MTAPGTPDASAPPAEAEGTACNRPARRLLTGIATLLGTMALLIAVALALLDTSAGHRFVAERMSRYEFENGLRIGVGRIEGSLYGRAILHDVSLSDPRGAFLTTPEADLDWRPFSGIGKHLDIRSLIVEDMTLHRLPALRSTSPSQPLLPDLDIDIGNLAIERLTMLPAVSGSGHLLSVRGMTHVADRRVQARLSVATLSADNSHSTGDHIELSLDAVPDANRLNLSLDLDAPAGGLVTRFAGLDLPLALHIGGQGDWRHWAGSLRADLGDKPLARLSLTAENGTFALAGPLRLENTETALPAAKLVGNAVEMRLSSRWQDRRAFIDGHFAGPLGLLDVRGGADLGRNRFELLHVDFRQREPGPIAPNITGQGVVAGAILDGDFARASIAYRIEAAVLAFGGVTVSGFDAQGRSRFVNDHWIVPVTARANNIAGLDALAGGALGAADITGDLAIDWPRIVSDNLRIHARRIDAKAIVLADAAKGFYAGTFAGRVANYSLQSVGLFNLDTNADVKSLAKGGFSLAGQVRAKSIRLFDKGLDDFLGGTVSAAAKIYYDADRIVRFGQIRIASPNLTVQDGSATYGTDGRITLNAHGTARDYGEVTLALTGSVNRPHAIVSAQKAGMGIGIANLQAELRPEGSVWRILAKASSDLGPIEANLRMGQGAPHDIDIERANLAGIDLGGQVHKLPGGPFAGKLKAHGQGVEGVVVLDAAGHYQHLSLDLVANNTILPGPAKVSAGRAIIKADAIFYDRPQIQADVQLARARVRNLDLAAMRVQLVYRSGTGTIHALTEGSNGVPFRFAINGDLHPDLWRIAVAGKINGISVATAQAARLVPENGNYRLSPTRINIDRGTMDLAGEFGRDIRMTSTIDKIDLALLDAFRPGLRLNGAASGTIAFRQDRATFPEIGARLAVTGLRHATAYAVSRPLDINLVADTNASSGTLHAVARLDGAVAGRLEARLVPAGPDSGGWIDQLAQGSLQGGVRYTGPADIPFAVAALPDQRLSGPIAIAADFSCTLASPCLNGVLGGNNLVYENGRYGTRLTGMSVTGRFTGERLQIDRLNAVAGDGTVSGQGYIDLSSAAGYPAEIALSLVNARVSNNDALRATASGAVQFVKSQGAMATLTGTVQLPATQYRIIRQGAAQVPELEGVHYKQKAGVEQVRGDIAPAMPASGKVALDLHIVAPGRFRMNGLGLDSEWSADLKVTGTSDEPHLSGTATLQRGTLEFAGRSFTLTEGRILFPGTSASNSQLRLVGEGNFEDLAVTLTVTGSATRPQIGFSSAPGLPQDEIVARILFGNSIGSLSAPEALQLAASLNSLRGSGTGLNPLSKLQAMTGFDRLRILAADATSGRGTSLALGKHISDRLYIEIVTDARGYTATQLEIALSRSLSILSQTGSTQSTNFNLRYRKTY